MPPTIQQQRDNLRIGLHLVQWGGDFLEDILRRAMGYTPNGPYSMEHFDLRFRSAQRVGREAFESRTPGYFTFNAMPFGSRIIYKATWYIWINPNSNRSQIVPIPAGDLRNMRNLRDKDLRTRQSTTRSIRTADNIEQQSQAVRRSDMPAVQFIQARMSEDGSLGEWLSGLHGLPYADLQHVIPQLANQQGMWRFQRDAADIRNTERRLRQMEAQLSASLTSLVIHQTGLPANAPQLALQQAQRRLLALP